MVRVDDEDIGVGKIERTTHFLEDIRQTRHLLDLAVSGGSFSRRDETLFDFVEIYDSPDAWEALLAKDWVARAVVEDDLLNEALRMMDEGRCEIVIGQNFRALTLERP